MRLKSANKNRKRALARKVSAKAKAFHEARCERLESSAKLWEAISDSGYVRRLRSKDKAQRSLAKPAVEAPLVKAPPPARVVSYHPPFESWRDQSGWQP